MSNKIILNDKLDFTEIDLTDPSIVVSEITKQLPDETNGLVNAEVNKYDGKIMSYTKRGLYDFGFLELNNKEIDIQKDLGEQGDETYRYECFLYTPKYQNYRYRMFFFEYHTSNYPVTIVLEESVARSISTSDAGYIYSCKNREELENLLVRIFTCKRSVEIMQELIRISQAKCGKENVDDIIS